MKYHLYYRNDLAMSVDVIYFNKSDKDSLKKVSMSFDKNDKLWQTIIDIDDVLIYKFIVNEVYYLNDPRAESYIFIDRKGIFSSIYTSQLTMARFTPVIDYMCICLGVDELYNPIGITDTITSLDGNVICFVELNNVKEDLVISMFWKNPKQIIVGAIDIFIKSDHRKKRKAFSGIDLKDLDDCNLIINGKWTVEIFINGVFMASQNFILNKFELYVYRNNSIYKRIL